MNADRIDRYLTRLAVDRRPPSVEAIFELHRAHIERIPYETTWIHLGEQRSVDTNESIAHLIDHGRGGYCFQLNGALSVLLDTLGYHVTMHVGGVHGETADAAAFTNHMVLTVADLPTDTNPAGTWYVDAGLGDALHEPLPLLAGRYRQGPMEFHLSQPTDGIGDWRLTHDPKGSFAAMSWQARAATTDEYARRHAHLSTSPLDDRSMTAISAALRRLLDAHDPYPGIMLDRRWNVIETNASARQMLAAVPAHLCEPAVNLFRVSLHPQGLAAFTTNIDLCGADCCDSWDRLVSVSDHPVLVDLRAEVDGYPNVG